MECKGLSFLCLLTFANFEDVSKYVSEIIKDVTSKDVARIHDVAFLPLGDVEGNLIYHNSIAKVSMTNPTMVTSFAEIQKHYGFKKPSFIVIVADLSRPNPNQNSLSQILKLRSFSESSKFIFISTKPPFNVYNLLSYLGRIFAHNFIAIDFDGKKRSGFSANFFKHIVYKIPPSTTDSTVIFEDKLKDMNEFTFKIAVIDQFPRIMRNAKWHLGSRHVAASSVDTVTFGWFLRHFNARAQIIPYYHESTANFAKKVNQMLSAGSVELTLNTMFPQSSLYPKDRFINTYDDNGYCAIVPIPPRKSFLHYLLTPFDVPSWMMFVLCVASCAVLWHFLKKKDSALYFVYAVATSFVGQSIPINERGRILTTLFQLCILMTFIMGNAYESLLISSMSASREGTRLRTFDDLYHSNFNVKADMIFYNILKRSGDYNYFVDRTEVGSSTGNPNYRQLSELNYAIVARCDMIVHEMKAATKSKMSNYYYMIPEKVMPFYEQFRLSDLSPFHNVIQRFYDRVFESGIRQHLVGFTMFLKPLAQNERIERSLMNEEYLLGIDDVYGVFYIVLIGHTVSVFIFLMESVYYGCLKNAYEAYTRARRKKLAKQQARKKRVRRIQVQPALSF